MMRDDVHQALATFYDNVALADSALLARFPSVAAIADLGERARRLRAVLLEAIGMLRPSRRVAFGSRESRSCDVLTLRYVERKCVADLADELSLGQRQVFRDLTLAEERLAQILSTWAGNADPHREPPADGGDGAAAPDGTGEPMADAPEQSPPAAGRHAGSDSLSRELAVLASQRAPVRLTEVLGEALALTRPLAARHHVDLRLPTIAAEAASPDGGDDRVVADRAMLRQVFTQLFSWGIQNARGGSVRLSAAANSAALRVSLVFECEAQAGSSAKIVDIRHIAEHAGFAVNVNECRGYCDLTVVLERRQPATVLVVEDNPSAVELYRRYLAGGQWQVCHVSEPRLTLETARRVKPDVVVLDVMMPQTDGWSVLQALRQQPETQDLPVVMCSVVEDPELSAALGAAVCLKKPVSQGEFLAALHRCLRNA
jgi:CheY-like chemotaxis protein